jgi:glutamate synthase (NADPH/NADH) small chain
VEALTAAGVRFRLGQEIRADEVDRLLADHDAVVVAAGAGRPLGLRVPGADLDGVWNATRFLTEGRVALDTGGALDVLVLHDRPATVLVLGAGNTAMDVARTARRLGAKAICVDWMDRRFAPVRPDELAEAEAEGVTICFNTTLDALEGDGERVRTARLARTHQSRATKRPKLLRRGRTQLDVDLVVMAMGYGLEQAMADRAGGPVRKTVPAFIDRRWVASGLLANPAPEFARRQPVGTLAIKRETARVAARSPRADRVWVAGDALTGPATVVEAMAQGKEAALGVISWWEQTGDEA